jgi:AraC-like DNA-binding protein
VLIVCIPRTEVEVHGKEIARAQGTVISTVTGAASLVGHVLRGMATQFDQPDEASFGRLSFHVVGLMSVMCAHVMGDGAQYESRSSTVEKAKEFIELNLADESLCPATVAAAHNVSSRTLHRLFEEENETPSRWIRLRRLERCRSDLLDESLAELSISDIGARWGVCDPAHFSRLFKAQFGVAPREFRRRARGGRRLESV